VCSLSSYAFGWSPTYLELKRLSSKHLSSHYQLESNILIRLLMSVGISKLCWSGIYIWMMEAKNLKSQWDSKIQNNLIKAHWLNKGLRASRQHQLPSITLSNTYSKTQMAVKSLIILQSSLLMTLMMIIMINNWQRTIMLIFNSNSLANNSKNRNNKSVRMG
jgi:hypothetical protein